MIHRGGIAECGVRSADWGRDFRFEISDLRRGAGRFLRDVNASAYSESPRRGEYNPHSWTWGRQGMICPT